MAAPESNPAKPATATFSPGTASGKTPTGAVASARMLAMKPHGLPGRLVTLDGTDGSGKTTSLDFIAARLSEREIRSRLIKMPSEVCRGMHSFRAYSHDPSTAVRGEIDLPALCMTCLADRLLTLNECALPLLRQGVWVLCDRYVFTPIAELAAIQCKASEFEAVCRFAGLFPRPDLAIVTTVPAHEALRRIRSRPDERDHPLSEDMLSSHVEAYVEVARVNNLQLASTESTKSQTFRFLAKVIDPLVDGFLSAPSTETPS